MFALAADGAGGLDTHGPMLDRPISEIALADIDGDGLEELATIEPFHGDRVVLYGREAGTGLLDPGVWRERWSAPAAFGHGLWGGHLDGAAVFLLSDRSERADLRVIRAGDDGELTDETVAPGVGAANMAVCAGRAGTFVAATEQARGEAAVYRVR
jgi:hypothetical protein